VLDLIVPNNAASANQFRVTTTGYLEVAKWGGGVVCTATTLPLSATTWYHCAFTYDGTNSALYVNGVACTLTGVTTPQTGTPSIVRVGSWGSGEYFNGQIDDVRIYNRALTQAEITQVYRGTWKLRPIAFVNLSGTWDRVKMMDANVSGTWSAFFNNVV
jgi:hypothetical protein